jgi:uncharacterized protein
LLCVGLTKKVDVSGVLATGRPLAVDAKVDVPPFGSYAFAAPVRVELEIGRVDRSIGISGTIEGVATGVCDRCLTDLRRGIHIDVDECFAPNGSSDGVFAEGNVLDGAALDVADLTQQLIDSSLPMVFLCSDDCPGLCPTCGRSRLDNACTCAPVLER